MGIPGEERNKEKKHSHASQRQGYILRNTRLGNFVVWQTS